MDIIPTWKKVDVLVILIFLLPFFSTQWEQSTLFSWDG